MESVLLQRTMESLSITAKKNTVLAISLICIFLFMYTAFSKLTDYHRFEQGLANVTFLHSYAKILSWFIPILEIIVCFLLIIPKTVKLGLYAFSTLMLIFIGYIAGMLLWAKHMPCGCGGVIESMSWGQHLWFNFFFLALAVIALWLSTNQNNQKLKS
jgi:uncharacterized membrane protein YphA (DoxX/SURF4 family)